MKLCKLERRHILHWAGYTLEDSLHWGNGKALLPSESELIKKLQSSDKEITLKLPEVNLIYFWATSYLKGGIMLIGEDIIILKKMLEYYRSLPSLSNDIIEKIEHIEWLLKETNNKENHS